MIVAFMSSKMVLGTSKVDTLRLCRMKTLWNGISHLMMVDFPCHSLQMALEVKSPCLELHLDWALLWLVHPNKLSLLIMGMMERYGGVGRLGRDDGTTNTKDN